MSKNKLKLLILIPGRAEGVNIDLRDSFFLGNLKLRNTVIRKLRKELANVENKFILFDPKLDADRHVYYEIFFDKEIPKEGFAYSTATEKNVVRLESTPPGNSK